MPISWNPNLFKIGIEQIDQQHQGLFDALNKLYDSGKEGQENQEMIRIMDYLGEYVVEHFDTEVAMLKDAGYPDLEKHEFQHNAFIKKYHELKQQLDSEGPSKKMMLLIYNTLYKWLVEHISASDKAYGNFLAKNRSN